MDQRLPRSGVKPAKEAPGHETLLSRGRKTPHSSGCGIVAAQAILLDRAASFGLQLGDPLTLEHRGLMAFLLGPEMLVEEPIFRRSGSCRPGVLSVEFPADERGS